MESATGYLRARTYMLEHRSPDGCRPRAVTHPSKKQPAPVAEEASDVSLTIAQLEQNGRKIIENASYAVFAERGEAMPLVLREIGRLREFTFRAVGEGTGKALDCDAFVHPIRILCFGTSKKPAL